MTTHRRYYFQHKGDYPEEAHSMVLDILKHNCEKFWWFNYPAVEGQPFNRLSFSFTVSGGEQWEAHKRAMKLAIDVYQIGLVLPITRVPEPMWEPLEPHQNRGRYRTPL